MRTAERRRDVAGRRFICVSVSARRRTIRRAGSRSRPRRRCGSTTTARCDFGRSLSPAITASGARPWSATRGARRRNACLSIPRRRMRASSVLGGTPSVSAAPSTPYTRPRLVASAFSICWRSWRGPSCFGRATPGPRLGSSNSRRLPGVPRARMTAGSTTFSSSRMLPGRARNTPGCRSAGTILECPRWLELLAGARCAAAEHIGSPAARPGRSGETHDCGAAVLRYASIRRAERRPTKPTGSQQRESAPDASGQEANPRLPGDGRDSRELDQGHDGSGHGCPEPGHEKEARSR